MESQLLAHLRDHSQRWGFSAQESLLLYLADLLEQRLTRVDIIPDPSFAERYLQLYADYNRAAFKDFADSALFFCSLLPDYGQRRGLSMDYYAALGISTYYALADLAGDHRFTQLGNWFYTLQQFLNSALKPNRDLLLIDLLEPR